MTNITKLRLTSPPDSSTQGTQGSNMSAIFEASVDEVLPGAFVEGLAQELYGNTLPSSNPDGTRINEVPNPGDRFLYSTNNGIVSDVYADGDTGITAFLADGTVTGTKFYDAGILALDFDTTLLPGGCGKDWMIRVGYRPPEPGQNEQRTQITQLLSGRNGTVAPVSIPFSGATFDSSVERWIEQRSQRVSKNVGFLVQDGNVAPTVTPMRMPNHEEFPPLELEQDVDVLVISRNVSSPDYAHNLNLRFRNTMNSQTVTFGGRTMPRYTAHYEGTRTGRPITKNNSTYYRAETRIVLYESLRHITRQAFGTYYLEGTLAKKVRPLDSFGEPLDRVPLTSTGQLATSPATIAQRVYSQQKPVSGYSENFGYT